MWNSMEVPQKIKNRAAIWFNNSTSEYLSKENKNTNSKIYIAPVFMGALLTVTSWRRLLRVPWTARRSNQSRPKGDQSWVFIGRTDVEAETPILWPPDVKYWLIWKDPDVGKDWGQEEKGTTEDEMFGWHHRLDGHGFGWTPGVGDGQGGLACCGSWGRKELDTTERLNWTECCGTQRLLWKLLWNSLC